MADAFEELLGSDTLSAEVKSTLSEAWDGKLAEAKEKVAAELREEFATRYENDKEQMVEAMDKMLNDVIKKELSEFSEDKADLVKAKVDYTANIKEHVKVLNKFILETLKKEISELREDRKAQEDKFGKLEEFVLRQLTKELTEFHDDKRDLVNTKVKLVKEGKKVIAEAKKDFIKKAATKIEGVMESALKGEIGQLKEDIKAARENEFGRKVFESFAAEFMTSQLAEGTEMSKLNAKIDEMKAELEKRESALKDSVKVIEEAQRQAKVAQDLAEREKVMGKLLAPLSKDKRSVMEDLLTGVKTNKLNESFNKYLPAVIDDKPVAKQVIKENSQKTVITGNKDVVKESVDTNGDSQATILDLKKLAGIK